VEATRLRKEMEKALDRQRKRFKATTAQLTKDLESRLNGEDRRAEVKLKSDARRVESEESTAVELEERG